MQSRRGPHHPILSLHERSLSVLSCCHVDEVIIGAPWAVTQDLLTTFNVSVVVHGSVSESQNIVHGEGGEDGQNGLGGGDCVDRFELPKQLGIYRTFDSPRPLTTQDIIDRIVRNRKRCVRGGLRAQPALRQLHVVWRADARCGAGTRSATRRRGRRRRRTTRRRRT